MMKGLMGRCLSHETALDRVRAKAEQTEDELNQLRNWKPKMERKLELSEKARKSLEQVMEEAKKTLESKDKEIEELKNEVRQAKDVAVREYRDSDALITELGDSFHQGFILCHSSGQASLSEFGRFKVQGRRPSSDIRHTCCFRGYR